MPLGPCWFNSNADGDPKPPPGQRPAPGELAAYARQVAHDLVRDLERGAAITDGWTNEELGFALVDTALSRAMNRLAATNCWGRDNQTPSVHFWDVARWFLELGPLAERARSKPLGYAGDYEMLAWICQCRVSTHPLGRLLDRFFQSQAAVEAVRSRTKQAAGAMAEHRLANKQIPYRLVSVGSGPAIDVEQALRLLPASRCVEVVVKLLDLDEQALDHAQARLSPIMHSERLFCIRDNLYRLVDKPRAAAELAGSDCILCTGLFDYLADEPAQKLLQLFWRSLRTGGMLLVGNFAPHCPTRAYMEWVGNWYLLYRTPEELASLATRAGIGESRYRIGAERFGIDLFLSAWKD